MPDTFEWKKLPYMRTLHVKRNNEWLTVCSRTSRKMVAGEYKGEETPICKDCLEPFGGDVAFLLRCIGE